MAKPGRKPNAMPHVDWKVSIPIDIASEVDLLIFDPLRGKTSYGGRSGLVAQAVREFLERRKKGLTSLPVSDTLND